MAHCTFSCTSLNFLFFSKPTRFASWPWHQVHRGGLLLGLVLHALSDGAAAGHVLRHKLGHGEVDGADHDDVIVISHHDVMDEGDDDAGEGVVLGRVTQLAILCRRERRWSNNNMGV
jgi:hypothetical protein